MTDGVIITLATCNDTQNKSYLKIEFIDIFLNYYTWNYLTCYNVFPAIHFILFQYIYTHREQTNTSIKKRNAKFHC